MKTKYFHSLLVMILMFWVLMMVINGSKEIDPELKNESITKKEKKEVLEISESPILISEIQMNRTIYRWVIKYAYKFPLYKYKHFMKIIFAYLELTPVRTELQNLISNSQVVSRNGKLLLTVFSNLFSNSLSLLDLTTGNTVQTFTTENTSILIYSYAIADSNEFIACGTENGNIYIWDTISSELMKILAGHTENVHECCIFSNDTRIASASFDSTIRLWNVETDSYSCVYVLKLDGIVDKLLVSAKYERIFAPILDGGIIQTWNTNNGTALSNIESYTTNSNDSCVLFVADDDQCIGYINNQGTITIWNFMTNKYKKTISIAHDGPTADNIAYLSSKILVWYTWNEKLGLYDFEKNIQVYILPVKVNHAEVSENCKYLIFTRWDENNDEFLEVYWLETGISTLK